MSGPVDDATIGVMGRSLSRLSIRASVVASNLANVDTPAYRALKAEFAGSMEDAHRLRLQRTDGEHLGADGDAAPVNAELVDAPITRMRQDGNTVDVDREMTEFAAVQGRFGAVSEMIRKRFALLRYAVTDGKG